MAVEPDRLRRAELGRTLASLLTGDDAPAVESTRHCAQALADLFRHTTVEPIGSLLLFNLHKRLLRETLARTRVGTSFYQDPAYDVVIDTPADQPPDLTCYPLIDRQVVIDNFDRLISSACTFASACHTSGATGPSLSIYKSHEEIEFLWQYYLRLQAVTVSRAPRPLVLSFPNLYHGVAVRTPSAGKVFVSGVTDDLLINDAIAVLRRRYAIPGCDDRISVITGLSYQVEFFTSYALQCGLDLPSFGIKALSVVGNYTPVCSRQFLEQAWGAPVFERFTLTESIAGAARCGRCGHFHLDWHAIGEVVDVDTRLPIAEGVGHLVLTQLYPFVQMQPLIRYMTGDMVRAFASTCSNTLTFDFLGKAANCIGRTRTHATEWLLFPADIYEVINPLPDIRLFETFATVRDAHDKTVGSPPFYTADVRSHADGCTVIRLTFELRYAPARYPDRIRELRTAIVAGIVDRSPALAAGMRDDTARLDVDFTGPGALGNATRMKI